MISRIGHRAFAINLKQAASLPVVIVVREEVVVASGIVASRVVIGNVCTAGREEISTNIMHLPVTKPKNRT